MNGFPALDILRRGLRVSLSSGDQESSLDVVDRSPISDASTFPCERVTLRGKDGQLTTVFCKFEAGVDHNVHGHRAGVAYESLVYRRILAPLGASTPAFLGDYVDETGDTWLILEDLGAAAVGSTIPKMQLASAWIGDFHRRSRSRLRSPDVDFLVRHDFEYYYAWATRTMQYSEPLLMDFPWLPRLCDRFDKAVSALLQAEQVITHGEFYANNALLRHNEIRPVDWESAAIAAGEIDLAAAVEGRDETAVVLYSNEYANARWPDGPPASFAETLLSARVFMQLRWLGDRPEWTQSPRVRHRFQTLQALGSRLDLI